MEYIDIVNDNNEVIGSATQEEIYNKKLNHRIVHIFVIHPISNKIYFQKRSETKSFLPGYYCTSAGGHVQAGETYEKAAKRELFEEIGIQTPVKKMDSMLFISDGHKRFIELYITKADNGFIFRDGEVSAGEFFNFDDAKKLIEKNEKIHPQLNVCFSWFIKNKKMIIR